MSSFSPTPQFCTRCGSALPPGALFCTTCGVRVAPAAAAAVAAPPPPPPPPPPAWEPAAPPPPTVPTQIVPPPRPPAQRGIWIAFGVVAALAVLAVGLWLGTRNSDPATTNGAGSTAPATSLAPSATPPAVQLATTTPGNAPTVATAPSATISPATAPPIIPPPATAPPATAPPVTAPPAHPCPTLHYNETLPLSMCDEGFPVQLLQTRLNELGGYGLEEDGQFGPASQAAVRAYQTEHGLAANGTADYPTWRSLFLGVGLPGEDLNGDGVITPEEIIYD